MDSFLFEAISRFPLYLFHQRFFQAIQKKDVVAIGAMNLRRLTMKKSLKILVKVLNLDKDYKPTQPIQLKLFLKTSYPI
ncbi:hypothetical protein [Chryseobacterium sp.]|uniref:hypothetical protein n=1 Tax=Chryseobacterium sp. TaxID=1871047 RepID=UPI00289778AD|nr:hypothetical protein [Chryseobacterium sp.]